MNRLVMKDVSYSYTKQPFIQKMNLEIKAGECVGLLGDSGAGKTTIGKLLAGYEIAHKGIITVNGSPLPKTGFCNVQLIGQHPQLAFDEKMKMGITLSENGIHLEEDSALLKSLGIKDEWLHRYPVELSGGQLQRFSIARALNKKTKYIIADEITAMLDPLTQAQIWTFLLNQMKERNLGILAITHNKSLAEKVCGRVLFV